jgi:O-antigen/teichoic acid export membrane protein
LKAFINRLFRSEFLRHTAILTSGTTLAQAIAIFTAPVLTRIYDPVFYDVLGLYLMVTAIIGSLVTLQYHNVIVTSADEEKAKLALSMCIAIGTCISILTLVLVLILFPFLAGWFHNERIPYWLLLAPISVFFGGWNMAFGAWANRQKRYKMLSVNRIAAALLVPVFSISLGILVAGPAGLIIGLLVSQVIPAILLSRHFFSRKQVSLQFSWPKFRQLAKENAAFPKYSLPSELINNVINQLPVIMFATYYPTPGAIGNYNLSSRMLGMPIQLVAASVLEVFRQRASAEFSEKGNCHHTFNQTFKLLFFSSLLPFIVLALAGPWIFSFVFGNEWELAGRFSQIMTPLFFLKFVVSPLSYVFFIAGKQKEDLIGHIAMIVLVLLSFVISRVFSDNFYHALVAYTIAYGIIYLYYLLRSYHFSKGQPR